MTTPPTPITRTTATAEITLVRPGWIEQYYLPGTQFSQDMLVENQDAIAALSAYGPCVLLSVFDAGMKVMPPLMNRDHFREHRPQGNIRALAVVTDGEAMHTAAKLYFMYHLQPFETQVFEDEHDARAGLRERLRAHGLDHTAQDPAQER